VAAVLVAGCSSATAPPADTSDAGPTTAAGQATTTVAPKSARGDGDEAAIETVPWDEVGPGWTLATWTLDPYVPGDPPATAESGDTTDTTLYLVDPSGDRYPITTFPSHGNGYGPQLVDWSGDGEQALINDRSVEPPTTIIVDLQSGEQTVVPIDGDDRFDPRFTLPSGEALLLTHDNGSQPPTLERVDLGGERELLYPADTLGSPFGGDFLSTPDGTQLVLGLDAGSVAVMGNDGTVVRTLSAPGVNRCSPARWWDGGTGANLLAHCSSDLMDQPQLWQMPIDGGAPTALTAPNTQGGDFSAWQLPAGTFVQTASQCSTYVLEKLNDDGTTSPVTVPGTDPGGSVFVIGVSGDDLIVRAAVSCGPGEALIDYDPAANTSTVLLGPSVNGGSVTTAVAYPGQD
jgi:TolB protein